MMRTAGSNDGYHGSPQRARDVIDRTRAASCRRAGGGGVSSRELLRVVAYSTGAVL